MTDATQDQPDELLAELERLRASNRKLLDELKTAKARASASADELEAARVAGVGAGGHALRPGRTMRAV